MNAISFQSALIAPEGMAYYGCISCGYVVTYLNDQVPLCDCGDKSPDATHIPMIKIECRPNPPRHQAVWLY